MSSPVSPASHRAPVATHTIAASGAPPLKLRDDDAVSGAFLLQLAVVVAMMGAAVLVALPWLAKRYPTRFARNASRSASPLTVLGRVALSPRSRMVLVQVEGQRVIVVESNGAATLQMLPAIYATEQAS